MPSAFVVGGVHDTVTARGALWVTLTDTASDAEPPSPEHDRLNEVSVDSGPTVACPEIARAPDQPPEAMQDLTLLEDQASVAVVLGSTEEGVAVKATVGFGAGDPTVTTADRLTVPLEPVQVSVKVVSTVSGPDVR